MLFAMFIAMLRLWPISIPFLAFVGLFVWAAFH